MVGISPLNGSIDVLPGWHKVGYFPNDYRDSNKLTSKEKILNDILVMGRLDVFVEEGKHETIVLNYQTLDEEVIDYNKKFQTGTVVGFFIIFHHDSFDELGVSLRLSQVLVIIFLYQIFFFKFLMLKIT